MDKRKSEKKNDLKDLEKSTILPGLVRNEEQIRTRSLPNAEQ